jgi:hypothetical protein
VALREPIVESKNDAWPSSAPIVSQLLEIVVSNHAVMTSQVLEIASELANGLGPIEAFHMRKQLR